LRGEAKKHFDRAVDEHRRLNIGVAHPLRHPPDIGLGDHARTERVAKIMADYFCEKPLFLGISNAPERIRTSDLRFRRPTLYPAELRAQTAQSRLFRLAAIGFARPDHD
jgi:hypothetical protein